MKQDERTLTNADSPKVMPLFVAVRGIDLFTYRKVFFIPRHWDLSDSGRMTSLCVVSVSSVR